MKKIKFVIVTIWRSPKRWTLISLIGFGLFGVANAEFGASLHANVQATIFGAFMAGAFFGYVLFLGTRLFFVQKDRDEFSVYMKGEAARAIGEAMREAGIHGHVIVDEPPTGGGVGKIRLDS